MLNPEGTLTHRQIVAVAPCHSIPKCLPLYGQLSRPDIHHVDILGAVDGVWCVDTREERQRKKGALG